MGRAFDRGGISIQGNFLSTLSPYRWYLFGLPSCPHSSFTPAHTFVSSFSSTICFKVRPYYVFQCPLPLVLYPLNLSTYPPPTSLLFLPLLLPSPSLLHSVFYSFHSTLLWLLFLFSTLFLITRSPFTLHTPALSALAFFPSLPSPYHFFFWRSVFGSTLPSHAALLSSRIQFVSPLSFSPVSPSFSGRLCPSYSARVCSSIHLGSPHLFSSAFPSYSL